MTELAVIAGSGMGDAAGAFDVIDTVPFASIEGVGDCTVDGHRGEVAVCADVMFVLGRRHLYEGEPGAMRHLFRWMGDRGVNDVVVASAAGSLRGDIGPGEFVVVSDALDMQNRLPVRVDNATDRPPVPRPPRAPGVHPILTAALEAAARRCGVGCRRGTLACLPGPTYETPAEVAMLQHTGADVVTMSAAPEILLAGECGMRVAALAAVTNPATGIGHAAPDHAEVLSHAARMGRDLGRIVRELIATM